MTKKEFIDLFEEWADQTNIDWTDEEKIEENFKKIVEERTKGKGAKQRLYSAVLEGPQDPDVYRAKYHKEPTLPGGLLEDEEALERFRKKVYEEKIINAKNKEQLEALSKEIKGKAFSERSRSVLSEVLENEEQSLGFKEQIRDLGLPRRALRGTGIDQQLEGEGIQMVEEAQTVDELELLDFDFVPNKSARSRLKLLRNDRILELGGKI